MRASHEPNTHTYSINLRVPHYNDSCNLRVRFDLYILFLINEQKWIVQKIALVDTLHLFYDREYFILSEAKVFRIIPLTLLDR